MIFNLSEKATIGKSLAGIELGTPLEFFLKDVKTIIDERSVKWTVNLTKDNVGLLLYKLSSGGSFLYLNDGDLELGFNKQDFLISIEASCGYEGSIYEDVKIGDPLGKVKHQLYLDDANDVHHLCDENEEIIPGMYFIAGGVDLEDDPDQEIVGVCIYDWSLDNSKSSCEGNIKFEEKFFSKTHRFSVGIETASGNYFLSIPVTNGIVDYEEYYQITESQFTSFQNNPDEASDFLKSCRSRQLDHLLFQKPGSNRGTPC
ncbi:hypothetical protein [Marinibactrum halimedae]|uniref:Uncharacterized protein n=1 Tax=Marinibactrum halimedae TaxID=1444977 RepID=A0AA37T1Z1_9GAMM|nr:hypothetical protein [Marinibactrum halimedae]MCD9460996.1 hypothetical protein [Marinibactrum halimedae]GLS24773.1 hypothetical protein GCM10007877_04870 [Marinibactrum halimedae]